MMAELAVQSRRRQVRPPHPSWWKALAVVLVSLACVAVNVVVPTVGAPFGFGAGAVQVQAYWRQIVSPYRNVPRNEFLTNLGLVLNGVALALALVQIALR